jgi:hydroxyacylglutathione hydrolase
VIVIETQAVGPFFKNGFVVACERTRQAILIDPGDEVASLLAFAKRQTLTIRYILLTHAHVDHVTGVPAAKRALGVPIYLHPADLFLYERAVEQGLMFGLQVDPLPPIDEFYTPGQIISFGDYETRVYHTPGHCPGGVCLRVGKKREQEGQETGREKGEEARGAGDDLFVGDTLFAGSIGRTDLPGSDYATLINSIRTVLFPLGDAARVHPGHGPSTTIGQERRTNPFLTAA